MDLSSPASSPESESVVDEASYLARMKDIVEKSGGTHATGLETLCRTMNEAEMKHRGCVKNLTGALGFIAIVFLTWIVMVVVFVYIGNPWLILGFETNMQKNTSTAYLIALEQGVLSMTWFSVVFFMLAVGKSMDKVFGEKFDRWRAGVAELIKERPKQISPEARQMEENVAAILRDKFLRRTSGLYWRVFKKAVRRLWSN